MEWALQQAIMTTMDLLICMSPMLAKTHCFTTMAMEHFLM